MNSRPLLAVIVGLLLVFGPGIGDIEMACPWFDRHSPNPIELALTPSFRDANAGELVVLTAKALDTSKTLRADQPVDDIREFRWNLDGEPGFEVSTGQIATIGRSYADTGVTYDINVGVKILRANGAKLASGALLRIHPAAAPSSCPGKPDAPDAFSPTAHLTVTPNPASVFEYVNFDGSASTDPGGEPLRYLWDLDGNGSFETDTGNTPTLSTQYMQPGRYHVGLCAVERGGRADDDVVDLDVTTGMQARALASERARRFSARIQLFPIAGERGRLRRRGPVRRWRGAMALGGVKGRLSGPPDSALTPLLDARWLARVNMTADSRTGSLKLSGLGLASSKGAVPSQACLRLRFAGRRGRRARGSFRVLGARGGSAGLAGRGSFGYRVDRRGRVRLKGLVRLGGTSRRSIPRACRRLEIVGP